MIARNGTSVQRGGDQTAWSPPPLSLHEARRAALLQQLTSYMRYAQHFRLDAGGYALLRSWGYRSRSQADRLLQELVESGQVALVVQHGAVYIFVRGGGEGCA